MGNRMMKKRRIALLAALLVLATALIGCTQQSMDDVLAEVDGRPIYRWYYQIYLDRQAAYYQQHFGVDFSRAEFAEEYQKYKEARLDDLIGRAAALNKAISLGFGQLTPAEEASLDEKYKTETEAMIVSYMESYGSDSDARSKAEKEYAEYLNKFNLTEERIRQDNWENYVLDKYYASVTQYGEVTDEEVQAYYDDLLTSQTKAAETDPDYLSVRTNSVMVYYPEGYVKANVLEIPFKAKDATTISAAEQAMSEAAMAAIAAIRTYGDGSAEANAKQEALEKALAAYNNSLAQGQANIQDQAQAVLDRLAAGEDFAAVFQDVHPDLILMDQYLSTRMTSIDAAIIQAAVAMTEPMSYSELLKTGSGLAIVRFLEKVEARTVPVEEVREQIVKEIEISRTFSEATSIRLQCMQEAKEIIKHTDLL